MAAGSNMRDMHQAITVIAEDECQYRIRSMHPTDIDTLITIEQITWPSEPWTYEDFLENLNDSLWNCWILESTIADTDNFILGYGFQHKSDKTKEISHIANICVHPDWRGCGLGGVLLRYIIDYARRTGASTVDLQVKTSNKNAYMLYDKHGFKIVQLLQQHYLDGSDAYQMQLIFS